MITLPSGSVSISSATIRVTPKNILVPPALETVAEKWLASIAPITAPATAADVNPFSGAMSLMVEPRLAKVDVPAKVVAHAQHAGREADLRERFLRE